MKRNNYFIIQWQSFPLMKLCLMMFAVLLSYTIQAQTIKGKVTAEDGKPVAGATIKVKGSNVGTVANNDGEYTLSNVAKNTVFVVSSIGYLPAEINIGTRTFVEIVLSADTRELGEVIVVGYGTQKKRDITGAVVSVSEKTLKEVPAPNLLNSLKGRAAGVSIVSNGSTPGSQASIRVRGNRSLTTGSGDGLDGPLVVVDGIPFGGLNDINPDDISNIEILKDASATAIYGSRGAGGVILVTTKRGKVGKPIFSYDGYHGITSMMGKYNVMNGEQYAKFKDLSAAYNTQGAGTTAYPLTEEEKANLAAGVSTDWQSLLYKPGFNTSHQLGLQGGVENTQYGMGIGYFNETGIMPNQNFDRMTIRATIDQKIGKHVKIGLNTINTLTHRNDPAGGGIPTELVRLSPLVLPYNADGSVNLNPKKGTIESQAVSPLTLISRGADILSNERSLRTFNSLYAEVNILDGLKYRFNAGLNFSQSHFNGYAPPNTFVNTGTDQSVSSADIRNTEYWDVNFQNLLYYDKVFAQKHKVSLTALYEITKNHSLGSNFNVKGVPADYIKTANFALASGTITANASSGNFFSETGLVSYMARLNYTFNNKYTMTATFRRDGSSTLSPGNQHFNYPAIGFSWNVIDEPFMQKLPTVSNLKLRGGWGISGNRNVDPYATLGALSAGYYNFGTTTAGQALAYTVTSLPASNLGWQSTAQWDFGLEIGLFNNRVTGSFDVYKQSTKDILLSVNLPQSNGAGSALKNLGKTEGSGFESSVTIDVIRSKSGFNWSTDLTYFFNREKITQLTTPTELDNKGNYWFVGQPLTVIYDYNKIGIWQQSDKDNGTLAKQTSPVQVPGEIRVEDVDGNGKIDANDRKVIGNFQPAWEGGFTNRVSYKNFDLSIVTYARMGMKVLVPYLAGTSGGGSGFGFLNQGRSNQLVMDYWTTDNPTNAFPRPNAGGGVRDFTSTTQYQDGSFIKVRSINVGYTLPSKMLGKLGFSSARVYINATNPLILYSPLVRDKLAIDPEGNGYGNTIQGGNFNRVISVNLNNPPVRQFTLGVNLKF